MSKCKHGRSLVWRCEACQRELIEALRKAKEEK